MLIKYISSPSLNFNFIIWQFFTIFQSVCFILQQAAAATAAILCKYPQLFISPSSTRSHSDIWSFGRRSWWRRRRSPAIVFGTASATSWSYEISWKITRRTCASFATNWSTEFTYFAVPSSDVQVWFLQCEFEVIFQVFILFTLFLSLLSVICIQANGPCFFCLIYMFPFFQIYFCMIVYLIDISNLSK